MCTNQTNRRTRVTGKMGKQLENKVNPNKSNIGIRSSHITNLELLGGI